MAQTNPEQRRGSGALREVLSAAVTALGGAERPGQVRMAEAVAAALESEEHLLVQAGTGTGKSLAYLVPALLHGERVVVATATLALQHQLVERDLPRLLDAVGDHEALRGTQPRTDEPDRTAYAVLKGRSNYACLHRIREGVPDDQGALVDLPEGSMGEQVLELRSWAETEAADGGTGERDHAPRHTDRTWRQVSVSARECLGATRCAFGEECFAERARERAGRASVVVTNHSLLAIDAIEGVPMIPSYDAVVVDEAHELAARVTQAATDEVTAAEVERVARRCQRHVTSGRDDGADGADPSEDLADAGTALREAIAECPEGRLDVVPQQVSDALVLVRDAARACLAAITREKGGETDPGRQQARAWLSDLFDHTERMVANGEDDVLWCAPGRDRVPARLCVAPLHVAGTVRSGLLEEKTVVLTSATLRLGGDFHAVAAALGLREDDELAWTGLDVGSPFDYPRQGILYVARHLPPPGRDGLGPAQLDELAGLVDAADGRTLGLFSSRRAAETAAEAIRERLPHLTTVAQGEAQLAELAAQFVGDPHTCLFGTLSLWQGLDVPGETCQLVVIDRIPFPRPDDPLASARQRAADAAGGNGFMQVSATHAALLLAQGTGRLIRSTEDRGVVAVLDPRLATARYGGFLRAGLPPMWQTFDGDVVREALRRLSGQEPFAQTK